MFKYILLFTLVLAATLFVVWPNQEIVIGGYDGAKPEIVRKLRVHQDHIAKLNGDAEFEAYRINFKTRSEQIIQFIAANDVRFYNKDLGDNVMIVKGFSSWVPRRGIFVNNTHVHKFQKPDIYTQYIIAHELSHMAFWSYDADTKVEDLKRSELPEYGDWYDLVILFADRQEYLDKIILGQKVIDKSTSK